MDSQMARYRILGRLTLAMAILTSFIGCDQATKLRDRDASALRNAIVLGRHGATGLRSESRWIFKLGLQSDAQRSVLYLRWL